MILKRGCWYPFTDHATLSNFVIKERGRRSGNFDFYKDIMKPYKVFKKLFGKAFSIDGSCRCFWYIWPTTCYRTWPLQNGGKNYTDCFLSLKNDEALFLDNTVAENEWLQMNLLLTIVMIKEIPASLKWVFNNE